MVVALKTQAFFRNCIYNSTFKEGAPLDPFSSFRLPWQARVGDYLENLKKSLFIIYFNKISIQKC